MSTPGTYHTILIPTRPQVDTMVGIFLLREFGKERFPGVESARIESRGTLRDGESEESLLGGGTVPLDIGGGAFDHHGREEKTTTSQLIAEELGAANDPAIEKLLAFAERDDFYGKGIVSSDSLDRAFGIPAAIVNLTKEYPDDPNRVFEIMLPVFLSHYHEEVRRTQEMPREVETRLANNEAEEFSVKQRGKKLRVIIIESDNISLPGFLRSRLGGSHDVVAQRYPSGHTNILTRPAKRVDLRSLVVLLRAAELRLRGKRESVAPGMLAQTGRLDEVPEWYYDPATNSLHNGGVSPGDTPPTKITRGNLRNLLEMGLSEKIWSPTRLAK